MKGPMKMIVKLARTNLKMDVFMVRLVGLDADVVNITPKKIKSTGKEILKDKEVTVDKIPKEMRKKILRMMMRENKEEEEEKDMMIGKEIKEKKDLKKEKIEEIKDNMKKPTIAVMMMTTTKLVKIPKMDISEKDDEKDEIDLM